MNCSRHVVLAAALILAGSRGLPAQGRGGSLARTSMNQVGATFVLHGSVVLPDDVAPRRIVRLEQVCAGQASGLAFTDSKGRYSFDLGLINNQTGAAAVAPVAPLGRPAASFTACSIRATLEGFRGDALAIGDLVKTRKTDAPPIVLHPLAKDINAVLSATDAGIAAAAKKDYDRGLDLVAQGKWKDAIKAMEKAASGDPKFATAWLSAGMLQVQQKDTEGARKSFGKAIAADEKFATPYIELAVVETVTPSWEKVAELTGKAIELDADSSARAYYLNTMANIRLRKIDVALKNSTTGVRLDQDHAFPELQYMNGLLLANTGDRVHGKAQLESYLELAPNGDNADNAREQLKKLAGAN